MHISKETSLTTKDSLNPTNLQKRCPICDCPVGAHRVNEQHERVLCNGEKVNDTK